MAPVGESVAGGQAPVTAVVSGGVPAGGRQAGMFDGQIGRAHALALIAADRQDRAETEAREAAAEVAAHRAVVNAEAYREVLEIQRAMAVGAEARAARQAEAEREQRAADFADMRDHLLRTGHQFHTVAEALAAERGMPR